VPETKAIVSLSGGLDSTVVLANALNKNRVCEAVGFTYGSKHNSYENEAAKNVAKFYNVPFKLFDLSGIMAGFNSNLLKSGGEVPEGHYEHLSMSQTVVPGRNLIFASILAGYAWSQKAQEVWLGIHAGDHFIYPDCRPDFYSAAACAVEKATAGSVILEAPYLYSDKSWIIVEGQKLKVPFNLTRTCYKDQSVACGKCGSCRERLHSFQKVGIADPLEYEFRDPNPGRTEA
jgi:7-cyano-7-deazaguanine synthase